MILLSIYSGADGTRIGAESGDPREIAEESSETLFHEGPADSLSKPAGLGALQTSGTNENHALALPPDPKLIALASAIDGLLAAGLSEAARPLLRELLAHVLRPTDGASVNDDGGIIRGPVA